MHTACASHVTENPKTETCRGSACHYQTSTPCGLNVHQLRFCFRTLVQSCSGTPASSGVNFRPQCFESIVASVGSKQPQVRTAQTSRPNTALPLYSVCQLYGYPTQRTPPVLCRSITTRDHHHLPAHTCSLSYISSCHAHMQDHLAHMYTTRA